MTKKSYTLRKKLLLWLLVPLLILFAIRAVYNYYLSFNLSNEVYDNALYDLAMALKQQVTFVNGQPTVKLSSSAQDILLYDRYDHVYFAVRDATGRMIAGNKNIPPPPQWVDSAMDHQFSDGDVKNNRVRIISLRVPTLSGHENRFFFVVVAETISKRKMLAHEIISSILIPQALIIILASIMVWFGVGRGLGPLQKLQVVVANRSHRDLSPIDDVNVPQEARPLVLSINDLMKRLQSVLDSQNRFVADAAHQLRTPVAGLMAQIGFALRQNDPEASKHCMEQLYVSAERMTRLVNQLLSLARSEPDADKALVKKPIDLYKLVSETVMEWVPVAVKKSVDLGLEGKNQYVMILGDESRLKEMINNLLDNAIRYIQPAGKVTVRITTVGAAAALVVEDNGPGIPPEERESVFERFYRVPGNKASGSGLGLAIVRNIARAHNAEVFLADNPVGRGVVVKVIFW